MERVIPLAGESGGPRIIPVILGQGKRLFPDAGPDIALDPVESRAFEGRDDPGLPARRAPAIQACHGRLRHECKELAGHCCILGSCVGSAYVGGQP